jgi:nucleotide-binding universal stress UspA family protein
LKKIVCPTDFSEPSFEALQAAVELARHFAAELIVIATRGQTGFKRLVFGSVAEKVVRLAGVPVLSIRGPRNEG